MPNSAPVVENLGGDGVTFDAGGAAIRLDAGINAAISDSDPFGFEVTRIGTGFSGGPLFMTELRDSSGRMLVVEKSGLVKLIDPAGVLPPSSFLDVSAEVETAGEKGLLGLTLAPDFPVSGLFYVYLTNLTGDNEVRRYQTGPSLDVANPATGDRILLIPHTVGVTHNAGWIGFGPDGFLYIASGDGGGGLGANAQSLNTLLGKILRIDPATDSQPGDPDRDYAIPAGNPYAGATPGLDEIWASGLRNPFRASFDPLTGNLYIGDVGENAIEEINLVPAGQGGLNFGWNVREGTQTFTGPNSSAFTPPVAQYSHGAGPFQGSSVTGGLVYRGPIAGLDGQYVFGDFFDKLWSVPVSSLVQGSTQPSSSFALRNTAFGPASGTINQVTSFATDQSGNLYITDLGGEIFRVGVSSTPNFAGGRLAVEIGAGQVPTEDRLGFAAGSVTLSNGTNSGSQVSVAGVIVGTIAPNGTGVNGEPLVVLFGSGATQPRVSALVQAITFDDTAGNPTPGTRSITIQLSDGAGTGTGGQDTAIVTTAVAVSAGAGGELTGAPGDDVLVGGISGDLLDGRGGNDTLAGGPGNDDLDGGAGFDIAVFSDHRSAYALAVVGDVIHVEGPDGADTLTGIERLQFTEGSYEFGPGFVAPVLLTASFGASASAGGWSSNDRYPRTLADIDGDGRTDLVGFGDGGVHAALANGDGSFGQAFLAFGGFGAGAAAGGWSSNEAYPRMLADVNGDERADLVGFGDGGVHVALATGGGSFAQAFLAFGGFGAGAAAGGWSSDRYPRTLADVDGDGLADLLGFGDGGVQVALATGGGSFAQAILGSSNFGASAAAGGWTSSELFPRTVVDINGDDRADVVGFGSAGTWVAFGREDGTFVDPTLAIAGFGADAVAGGWSSNDLYPRTVGDVDGDGNADLVGFGDGGVHVARGDGSGGFAPAALVFAGFGAGASSGNWTSNTLYPRLFADLDHDGALDIVGFGDAGVQAALSASDWMPV